MKGQLFTWTSEEEGVRLCRDPGWVAQQKFDGTRCLVDLRLPEPRFIARHGGPLKHSACAVHFADITEALTKIAGSAVILDGELIHYSGTYVVFDLLMFGESTTEWPQSRRRHVLELLFDQHIGETTSVVLAPEARTTAEKMKMMAEVKARHGEGVMFKQRAAGYDYDSRVTHSLKVKFRKSADCIVTERNVNGGCNARLGVYNSNGELVSVGGCSMIGKPGARPGDVVEVEFLYATTALTLYQPSMSHIRRDKLPEECTLDQLAPVDRTLMVRP